MVFGVELLWLWDCKSIFSLSLSGRRSSKSELTSARVAAAEGFFIYKADWDQAVEDAQDRNAAG